MRGVLLRPSVLVCPRCTHRALGAPTHGPIGGGTTHVHVCGGLGGLVAPLIPEGTRAKTEAVPRGDYIGTEVVQRDEDGRPWMAVEVTRDDGTDRTVLAPCARARGHS